MPVVEGVLKKEIRCREVIFWISLFKAAEKRTRSRSPGLMNDHLVQYGPGAGAGGKEWKWGWECSYRNIAILFLPMHESLDGGDLGTTIATPDLICGR